MAAITTDTQQAPLDEIEDEPTDKLFLIPQLIGVLRWIEELIVALSGYGIVFALAVGVVDLLTDGKLTQQWTWIDYAYAIAFAGAIAGQIIGLASRSSRTYGKGQWLRGTSYTVLVLLLAFTEYQAAVIFGYHKAFGTSVTIALTRLGIDQAAFIQLRAGVGVFLAVLSGYLRWQPTKRKTIAQLQRDATYKQQVAAIQAQSRAAGLANMAGLAGNMGQAARAAARAATASPGDAISEIGSGNPPDASETPPAPLEALRDRTNRYRATDAVLRRYRLPSGTTLTTEAPMTQIARLLNVKPRALSEAWAAAEMTHHPARPDQPTSTKNIAIWQVLALMEMGLLDKPE